MIEVEKKFLLRDDDIARLTRDARFVREEVLCDVYYDTPDFRVTRADMWLRERNARWELKVSLNKDPNRLGDNFRELETEDEIRGVLGLSQEGTFREDLERRGYGTFCTCITTRRKYKKGDFTIDLDSAEFDGLSYRIAEIELMVETPDEMEAAFDRIRRLALTEGLAVEHVQGKIAAYLKHKKPGHYEALVSAGVFREM
ncbi:MAG: CYTH domain-containing protein [bacterium]|nr:CYTH domain-containing protein [bacterium]MDZ4296597.1 CYTH domain-containing protein [Patescibacteria group bacterium]